GVGRDLQVAGDVLGYQLVDGPVGEVGEVHADAGRDVDALHAGDGAGFAHQLDRRGVARPEQLADRRVDAREAFADRLDLRPRTAHPVHVCGGPAEVTDRSLEAGLGGDRPHLREDRAGAPTLDDAA